LSLSTTSTVYVVANGEVVKQSFDPLDVGIPRAPKSALSGGDAIENAVATRAVLAGVHGPHRDAILLNAAATLAAFDAPQQRQLSLNQRMEAGLVASVAAIDSGAAEALLARWVELSQSIKAN
jgi:anthranilate phosphoribosyltransferase